MVDAFDAMTEDRSYHKGMSSEDAASEILRHAGSQFDPTIARIFVERILNITPADDAGKRD